MATLRLSAAYDMSAPPNPTGAATDTATYLSEGDGLGNGQKLIGSFTYNSLGQVVGGVVAEYQVFSGGVLVADLSGTLVSATSVVPLFQAGQISSMLGFLMSGDDSVIASTTGGDHVIGWAGNDFMQVGGGGGNDVMDGGTGWNTVIFNGPESAYSISYVGNTVATVTDSVSGRDGTVTSLNDSVLQFSDKPFFILNGDGANVARLYQAALGRTPDASGMYGWDTLYANNVSTADKSQGVYHALAQVSGGFNGSLSIADGFVQSSEFTAKYGALTNQGFITQLYQNVLGRGPDSAGLNGWLQLMTTGDTSGTVYSRGMVLVGFAESPENIANAQASYLVDTSRQG